MGDSDARVLVPADAECCMRVGCVFTVVPTASLPPPHCCVGGEVEGLLSRLHAEAADRMKSVYAPRSKDSLSTAWRSFARFAIQCLERELLKEKGTLSERQAGAWNEWTFILYAVWLASQTSKQTKRPVRARTIDTYISLIKGYLKFEYDFELPDRSPRLKQLLKVMKEGDPLAGVRKKCRTLRG